MQELDHRLVVMQNREARFKIISDVVKIVGENGPAIFDTSMLPAEKEVVEFAFLYEIVSNPSRVAVEIISEGALGISHFQAGVGAKPLLPDLPSSDEELEALIRYTKSNSSDPSVSCFQRYMTFAELASEERCSLVVRVEHAKYLNTHIQPTGIRLYRYLSARVRPLLFIVMTLLTMLVALPTFILPKQRRINLLQKWRLDWLNDLDEYRPYERALQWPDATELL